MWAHNHIHARLHDSCFLSRDLGKCRSQNLRVIQLNGSNNGKYRIDDIRGIVLASQTDLQHNCITALGMEMVERQSSRQFKEGGRDIM